MTPSNFDLENLLSPMSLQTFFAAYWEKQYLHLARGAPDYYKELITAQDLEDLISSSDARYPAIRLAKGGNYFAPEIYTQNVKHGDESFVGVPDVRKIADAYAQGATIAMPAIHRTWTPLGRLCDRIHALIDHVAHANVYITPGNTAGFTPHYDVHEVFVLQVAGKKRWTIHAPVSPLPHRTQLFKPESYTAGSVLAEIELTAGDLLYLPRGFIHSTTTSDSFSAHVTVGVTVYTWVDLVKEHLSSAIESEQLRHALPPGFASNPELKSALSQKLRDAISTLQAGADTDRLIDAFTERARAAHVRDWTTFKADIVAINAETALRMPPPSRYQITLEAKGTMLEYKGQRYQVTPPVASTLRAMAELNAFRPVDLPDHLPQDGKLAFSRHLYSIGFLEIVPSSTG
jgi:ribosomal protein L16 Arg81 hydroxylase